MDFEVRDTEEQRRFRAEVVAWMDASLLAALDANGESFHQWRAFRRALGERGWLAPSLSLELSTVLREELAARGLRWLREDGVASLLAVLHEHGTDQQRGKFLPLLADGRAIIWRPSLEGGAPLDTTTWNMRAFRDGDDFILTGEERFHGFGPRPDYLWTLAITARDASHLHPTAAFLVSADFEGVGIRTPESLVPGVSHIVTFDRVRVPPFCLIGEEGDGWSVFQTAAPADALAGPSSGAREVVHLLQYARETIRDGVPLSKEPYLQQLLVDAYLEDHVIGLLRKRNAWMAKAGKKPTFHAAQVARMEKRAALRRSRLSRDVMGPYVLLDHRDRRAPFRGSFELRQRESLAEQNRTGGPEVHAVEMAKQLELGERKDGRGPPIPVRSP